MANDIIPGGPVHFSRLKKMRLSAAHYLGAEDAITPSTGKGSALHSVLLGGKRVVIYEKARNKKHKAYQAFLEDHPDDLIVSPKEAGDVVGMRKAIESHPRAMALLNGERERLIEWETMGRKCAGTPDVVLRDGLPAMRIGDRSYCACPGKVVTELKTSKTASPWGFPWEAKRYGYTVQVSWYKTGVEQSLAYPAGPVSDAFLVVVESAPPYPVTVFHLEERALSKARMQWRSWMDSLLQCERAGQFPAYTDDDVSLGVDDDLDLDWGTDDEAAA